MIVWLELEEFLARLKLSNTPIVYVETETEFVLYKFVAGMVFKAIKPKAMLAVKEEGEEPTEEELQQINTENISFRELHLKEAIKAISVKELPIPILSIVPGD